MKGNNDKSATSFEITSSIFFLIARWFARSNHALFFFTRTGCFVVPRENHALGALLVVTCDVTWAAGPLSILLLPVLLPACVCSGRVTVVDVVIVTCNVACLSLRRVRWMFRPRRFVGSICIYGKK